MPMSGVRCPVCAALGQEVWVIPGRKCTYCSTIDAGSVKFVSPEVKISDAVVNQALVCDERWSKSSVEPFYRITPTIKSIPPTTPDSIEFL